MSVDELPQEPPRPKRLHVLIAEVMAEVGPIEKSRQMEAGPQKYKYRGIEEIVVAAQPLFAGKGVTFWPRVASWETEHTTTSGGKPTQETRLLVEWTVRGPAGDDFAVVTPGQALDSSDKGVSKAFTQSQKLMLLGLLMPPTKDADDPDHHSPQREEVRWATSNQREEMKRLSRALGATAASEVKAWAAGEGFDMRRLTEDQASAVIEEMERREAELPTAATVEGEGHEGVEG